MMHAETLRTDVRRNYVGPSPARLSSTLPHDARAVIEREPRAAGPYRQARRRGWTLRFERRRPYEVNPLTGWTAGTDPLAQVSLRFPDLASAIRYAERHDLPYDVRSDPPERRKVGGSQGFEKAPPARLCCWPTGPHPLCCGDYPVLKEVRAS